MRYGRIDPRSFEFSLSREKEQVSMAEAICSSILQRRLTSEALGPSLHEAP